MKVSGTCAARIAEQHFTIGVFAEEFDVTTRTIRFYEEMGLLKPLRRNGRRLYCQRDRIRMKLLLRGRRLGFTFEEIREILDAYDTAHDHGETQLRRLLEVIAVHREELDTQAKEISVMLGQLESLAQTCRKQLRKLAAGSSKRAAAGARK